MKQLMFLFYLFFSLVSSAQTGGIPTSYRNDPAVDLVYKGKLLLPEEAHELKEKYRHHLDLSLLDPVATSDIWNNTYPKELPVDNISISTMDEVSYHSPVLSPSGIFRFNILHKEERKLYTLMISKTVHSVLLAKSLLRKIGYKVPDIKYLPKVVLAFKNDKEKKGFISYLENVAFAGSASSWVVEDLGESKLVVQDLVAMESQQLIYNLAVDVPFDAISGRRLLSSLAVPHALLNLTESINMFRWSAGVKNRKEIVLSHERLSDFQCSWDDARWISRRIEKLLRKDWEEIVESSHLPKPVQQILVEKLISRRNSIMKLFDIDAVEMKVDGDVSHGVDLVKGKIVRKNWPGYAPTFTGGDPESPLSDSEMRSLIKSKAITYGIDLAISKFNTLSFMQNDLAKVNDENFNKYITEAVVKSATSGTPLEIPLRAWTAPSFGGELILSRNLVTGTYLGTDNLVQLVDTVGVSLNVGLFIGTMGLPSPTPVQGGVVSPNPNVPLPPLPVPILPVQGFVHPEARFVRSYAHLRPVTSIQKSLKYPFKNILVPLVKRDYGQKLHEATTVLIDENASEEEKQDKIAAALKPFKDSMEVGESILITDAVAVNLGNKLAIGYEKLLTASMGLILGHSVVSRFHLHRKSEHVFQIYKDLGQVAPGGMYFALDSLIPVLNIGLKKSLGSARVKFYSLNLDPKNPAVIENASLLRSAIVSSSVKAMEEKEELHPYVLSHKFKESNPRYNLFFWQWQSQNSFTDITVKNFSGDERHFRRHYLGSVKGRNYQKYVTSLIRHWVGLIFDTNVSLSDGGDNPGYSFKGRAETRYLVLDEEVDGDGERMEPFIRLTRIHNGWSIDRKKAEEIVRKFEHRYGYDLFNAPVLNDTNRIFLYNISFNLFFYQAGLDHLLNLDEETIKKIFRQNMARDNLVLNPTEVEDEDTGVGRFLKHLKKYRQLMVEGNPEKANRSLLKAISQAEKKLNLKGLLALVGGEENLYINSRIDGYREGDENGTKPIISDSIGEFGSSNVMGPVMSFQQQSEMLEGEFFIYWLMTRLI